MKKTPSAFVRQHIKEMPLYKSILPFEVLSEELGIPAENLVKLDANENPYGVLPEVRKMLHSIDHLHIYPDPESRTIRKLLVEYHQIPEGNILIGAGADELIDLILRLVIEPGDVLLNCPPTFGMYAFDGILNQAKIVTIPRRADFSLDLAAIEVAVKEYRPKLFFLANPNNPDGGSISREEFEHLVSLPLLLVVDEAYMNFYGEENSVIREAATRQNLIVLRTFSKWAGLAGLRIGYGVFPSELVPIFMRAKQPYNVSGIAEKAAVISLQNSSKLEKNTARIIEQRERFLAVLKEISWLAPYPSQANFILCRVTGLDAADVYQELRKQGVLIRYFNQPGLSDHLRISVGTKEQMDSLVEALKGIGR